MSSQAHPYGEEIFILIDISYKIYRGIESELGKRFNRDTFNNRQLAALIFISKHEQATPTAIAKHLGLSRPQVTRLLEALESNAYLNRVCNATDRRCYFLKLLPMGEEIVNAAKPILSSLPQSMLSSLTKEEKKRLNFFYKIYLRTHNARTNLQRWIFASTD